MALNRTREAAQALHALYLNLTAPYTIAKFYVTANWSTATGPFEWAIPLSEPIERWLAEHDTEPKIGIPFEWLGYPIVMDTAVDSVIFRKVEPEVDPF